MANFRAPQIAPGAFMMINAGLATAAIAAVQGTREHVERTLRARADAAALAEWATAYDVMQNAVQALTEQRDLAVLSDHLQTLRLEDAQRRLRNATASR